MRNFVPLPVKRAINDDDEGYVMPARAARQPNNARGIMGKEKHRGKCNKRKKDATRQ